MSVDLLSIEMSCGTLHFACAKRSSLPANGGLRVLEYQKDEYAADEACQLAERMQIKHQTYHTGFRGGKIVANVNSIWQGSFDEIITIAASELNKRKGDMFTGADLNFGNTQVMRLAAKTQYVLAALGSKMHYAEATASGALGAIAAGKSALNIPRARVLVHGAGAVGSRIIKRLVKMGELVSVYDHILERGNISGAVNSENIENWILQDWDIIVLASASRIIDVALARNLKARVLVCVANLPFASGAQQILEEKGTIVFDEGLSSAGAVMADSIEFYNPEVWRSVSPRQVYHFIFSRISEACFKKLESGYPHLSYLGRQFVGYG
ncbi:NAD(P)-dependent oxidoreductase [Microbulbifer sp. PSTR4-B]|uniref:NAD(P)-dependent oxidoreductase n=1 Tax=Microbulbifer sp. PSTR4-B TaxID=3243396 RepID=UPI004039388D